MTRYLTYAKNTRTLTQAIAGALLVSVALPRKPAESFENPSKKQIASAEVPLTTCIAKMSEERPCSTTIGHYARGFQDCQAVSISINPFFLRILYSIKTPEKTGKNNVFRQVQWGFEFFKNAQVILVRKKLLGSFALRSF